MPTMTAAERSEEDLMLASGQGDRAAFGLLVERHYPVVMHFVQRFLGYIGREAAEDLTQDVFLKAWKAAPRYEPRAAVRTWLLRSATNTCLDFRRRERFRRVLSLSADTRHELTDQGQGPAGTTEKHEHAERCRRAIAELPTRQRAAIVLRHYEGLSYADIAGVLGLSVPAVESLLFRARRRLDEKLSSMRDRLTSQVSGESGVESV